MTFPLHSRRLSRVLAAALVASALAAPAALAKPERGPVLRDVDRLTTPAPAPDPLIVRVADGGFDLGSAAIGAGGAGALLVLVSLGGAAYAARHPRVRPQA